MLEHLSHWLGKHPIVGPVLSATVLTCIGDTIAQQFVEKRRWKHHNWRRTLSQTSYGLLIIGPATCLWYRLLEARVKSQNPALQTLARVALDQLVFTPLFLGIYFAYNSIFEGSDFPALKKRVKNSYFPVLLANYCVWPAVQAINFYLIPLNYRLIFVNVVAIAWTAYLSNAHAKSASKTVKPADTESTPHNI